MSKKGYILQSPELKDRDADIKWMKDFGCAYIIEEDYKDEADRPGLHELVTDLGYGDELVVPRCSHIFKDMYSAGVYFDMFRNLNIRFVSIHDRIDSADELFPDTTTGDLFNVFANLSIGVREIRKNIEGKKIVFDYSNQTHLHDSIYTKKMESLAINMYLGNYHVDDILEACQYTNRTRLYRILHKYSIDPKRKKCSKTI